MSEIWNRVATSSGFPVDKIFRSMPADSIGWILPRGKI